MSFFKDLDAKLSKHKVLYKVLLNLRNYAILVVMLVCYFVIGAMTSSNTIDVSAATSVALYSIFVAVLCYIWYIALKKDHKIREIDIKISKKRYAFYILELLILTVGILFAFSFIDIYITDPTMESRREYAAQFTSTDLGLYYLATCTAVPIAEECMLRLLLYNILNTGSHWIVSMSVSSVIFALLHGTISHAVLATLFGMMMCLLYHNTGKPLLIIVGHILYNIVTAFLGDVIHSVANIMIVSMLCFVLSVSVIVFEFINGIKLDKTARFKT